MTDRNVKPVLNKVAGHETYHESPRFSINDANDVTANFINATAVIQDFDYHENPSKLGTCFGRFMKAHKVDFVKYSYLEGLRFTLDETLDVSLKHHLWFLKLQGTAQQQIQHSLVLHRKVAERCIIQFRAQYDSATSI